MSDSVLHQLRDSATGSRVAVVAYVVLGAALDLVPALPARTQLLDGRDHHGRRLRQGGAAGDPHRVGPEPPAHGASLVGDDDSGRRVRDRAPVALGGAVHRRRRARHRLASRTSRTALRRAVPVPGHRLAHAARHHAPGARVRDRLPGDGRARRCRAGGNADRASLVGRRPVRRRDRGDVDTAPVRVRLRGDRADRRPRPASS